MCLFSGAGDGQIVPKALYLKTIAKYKDNTLRYSFPKLLAGLIIHMEERAGSDISNDVLGEFYELHLSQSQKAQHFTPWPVCVLMAKCLVPADAEPDKPLRVLDPCCGSGRTLLAASKELGPMHAYYGIDVDPVCVKMTALNLFLNGLQCGSALCRCADAG